MRVKRTTGRFWHGRVTTVTNQNSVSLSIGRGNAISATRESVATTRTTQFAEAVESGTGGSMKFAGSVGSNLAIANDADFRFGTGDFTVEWWQYRTDSNTNPRVFAIGTYAAVNIGVSYESSIFYYWDGTTPVNMGAVPSKNVWHHIAITRSGTSLRAFVDGTQLGTTKTISTNYTNSTNLLRIGNETTASASSSFGGYITNFNWVKGTAKYTANFTPSTTPLSAHANSKLLLKATDSASLVTDSSTAAKTVTNNSVTWDSKTPF